MTFWIITSLMALAVSVMLAMVLVRGRKGDEPAAAYDLRVYRDQLSEVERDLARGTIAQADAERVRTEVSRRLLAADSEAQATKTARPHSVVASTGMAVVVILGLVGGSLWLYRDLGVPGYGDLGLARRIEVSRELSATRPDQTIAEAEMPARPLPEGLSSEYLALVQQLRDTVKQRPDDVQGLQLLARHEAAVGNFAAAHAAQARVIALKGDAAQATDYANYADMLILAAGGYVSPQAEDALQAALNLDRKNGVAQYYLGLMLAQNGRPDQAFQIWSRQLRESPPDAGWLAPIRAQIENVALAAGVTYTLPPESAALPGPSAADVTAADAMSPQDRQAMILNMVQGLSDRLASDGGPPEEWSRLIVALGVLGNTEQARAIQAEALEAYAGNDAALALIGAAAQQAGIAP